MGWMDGWGGVVRSGGFAPLANTDAGHIGYCSLHLVPTSKSWTYVMSRKGEKSDRILFLFLVPCLRRSTRLYGDEGSDPRFA